MTVTCFCNIDQGVPLTSFASSTDPAPLGLTYQPAIIRAALSKLLARFKDILFFKKVPFPPWWLSAKQNLFFSVGGLSERINPLLRLIV